MEPVLEVVTTLPRSHFGTHGVELLLKLGFVGGGSLDSFSFLPCSFPVFFSFLFSVSFKFLLIQIRLEFLHSFVRILNLLF